VIGLVGAQEAISGINIVHIRQIVKRVENGARSGA
jgi:hypothetical protein